MPFEFSQLTATQISTLSPSQTVFFFPVGPLEDHGPHLPIGLDLLEARALCELTALKLENEHPGWKGVIMPMAPLGLESNTSFIALTVRPHVLRDWLVDACQSLIRTGFVHFVCFSGHLGPKQLTAIEDAGKMITRPRLGMGGGGFSIFKPLFQSTLRNEAGKKLKPTLISASSAFVTRQEVWDSPLDLDPLEHGGKRDTSVAAALVPSVADAIYPHLPEQEREGSRLMRKLKKKKRALASYWGAPAKATAETGQKTLDQRVSEIFPDLYSVWQGGNPRYKFRSWYSLLPPNKSFFKAWVLGLLLAALLGAWFLMTLGVWE